MRRLYRFAAAGVKGRQAGGADKARAQRSGPIGDKAGPVSGRTQGVLPDTDEAAIGEFAEAFDVFPAGDGQRDRLPHFLENHLRRQRRFDMQASITKGSIVPTTGDQSGGRTRPRVKDHSKNVAET